MGRQIASEGFDEDTLYAFADDLVKLVPALNQRGKKAVVIARSIISKYTSDGSYRPDRLFWEDWEAFWNEVRKAHVIPHESQLPDRDVREALYAVQFALVAVVQYHGPSQLKAKRLRTELRTAIGNYRTELDYDRKHRRGPKLKYDVKDTEKLVRDWEAASHHGVKRKDFCAGQKIKLSELIRAQGRLRERKRLG